MRVVQRSANILELIPTGRLCSIPIETALPELEPRMNPVRLIMFPSGVNIFVF